MSNFSWAATLAVVVAEYSVKIRIINRWRLVFFTVTRLIKYERERVSRINDRRKWVPCDTNRLPLIWLHNRETSGVWQSITCWNQRWAATACHPSSSCTKFKSSIFLLLTSNVSQLMREYILIDWLIFRLIKGYTSATSSKEIRSPIPNLNGLRSALRQWAAIQLG